MPTPTRVDRASQLAQRLGPWRSAGEPGGGSGRSRALQAALAERITALVLDGRLPLATRLPAERALSTALDVSRTTVTAAYALLRESGFAVSRQGSGSYVSVPDGAAARTAGGYQADGGGTDVIDLMSRPRSPRWRCCARRCAARPTSCPLRRDRGCLPYGLDMLREAIADHYCARGLPPPRTDPGDERGAGRDHDGGPAAVRRRRPVLVRARATRTRWTPSARATPARCRSRWRTRAGCREATRTRWPSCGPGWRI